jgi:hypothetical protein
MERELVLEWTEVPGRGWVVHAPAARATASGETRDEALANLRSLIDDEPLTTEQWEEIKAAVKSLDAGEGIPLVEAHMRMPFQKLMEMVAEQLSADKDPGTVVTFGELAERWDEPPERIMDAATALRVMRGEKTYV